MLVKIPQNKDNQDKNHSFPIDINKCPIPD